MFGGWLESIGRSLRDIVCYIFNNVSWFRVIAECLSINISSWASFSNWINLLADNNRSRVNEFGIDWSLIHYHWLLVDFMNNQFVYLVCLVYIFDFKFVDIGWFSLEHWNNWTNTFQIIFWALNYGGNEWFNSGVFRIDFDGRFWMRYSNIVDWWQLDIFNLFDLLLFNINNKFILLKSLCMLSDNRIVIILTTNNWFHCLDGACIYLMMLFDVGLENFSLWNSLNNFS